MMTTEFSKTNVSVKKYKRKVFSLEDLQLLSKEELVERIVQVELHNVQLKNIITKSQNQHDKSQEELLTRKKRKFDFTQCSKRHVFMKLLYLGWDYQGFTVQEDSTNTIEHHLFAALEKCCLIENRESSNYNRCGRTDKGVSAFSQVISLDVRSKLSKKQLENNRITEGELEYTKILNAVLPSNIKILAWSPVSSNLSARFDCKQRTYRYFFPRGDLDIMAMNTGAQYLTGTHDFRNFCKMDVGNGVTNYNRHIQSISVRVIVPDSNWQGEGEGESSYDMCELMITGAAFLWHQVRCIMGVLLLIGQGKEKPEIIEDLLDIEKNPKKPQYLLASYLPLNLFDCEFDSLDWVINNETLSEVIQALQLEWTNCNVKSTMLKAMLEHCQGILPSDVIVKKQALYLFKGVTSKIYKPLMEREKCSSLENRIEHYVKKQRLKVVPSGIVPSEIETDNNKGFGGRLKGESEKMERVSTAEKSLGEKCEGNQSPPRAVVL